MKNKDDEKAAGKADKTAADAPPASPTPTAADAPSGAVAPDYAIPQGAERPAGPEPRDYARPPGEREPAARYRSPDDRQRRPPPPLPNMDADTPTQMRNAPSTTAVPDYSEDDPDADMVSVINHEPRLLVWPDLAVRNGDDPNGKVLRVIPGRRLIPGRNNVPREYLARMGLESGDHRNPEAHPHLARAFKHRMVSIGGDVSDPTGPPKPTDLSQVSGGVARELIRTETDPVQLDDWAATERRADVSRALVQRREELAARR